MSYRQSLVNAIQESIDHDVIVQIAYNEETHQETVAYFESVSDDSATEGDYTEYWSNHSCDEDPDWRVRVHNK
jgi:hypothetical protein